MVTDDRSASATPLRRSPLHAVHVAAGARMGAFAGWEMPIDYGSVVAEHMAVRSTAGVFDLTHLGTVAVSGPDAEAVLARSFTNEITALAVGRAHYSLCLDEVAGIIDDLLVYRLAGWWLVVPNAANTAAVVGRLLDAAKAAGEASVEVLPLACLAVQGPGSIQALTAGLAAADMEGDPTGLQYLDCTASGEGHVLSRSGYTGEVGFEVFCDPASAVRLWEALLAEGLAPAGLGCRDTLRLEMGYPLHGKDISTDTTPVDAGLTWAVKGSGFVGEEAYREAKEAGATRRLRGIRAEGRRAPRAGDRVLIGSADVGAMTSGSFSPVNEVGIGLAYLGADVAVGSTVDVNVRGRPVAATVVVPPFVKARTR